MLEGSKMLEKGFSLWLLVGIVYCWIIYGVSIVADIYLTFMFGLTLTLLWFALIPYFAKID